ncbi:hypothetical protein F5Y17DRAFT_446506 [Xylariaceae sp. FL0594]|nr:hypothetical protein F5Y17DRAFT_446506 [Xylariaceae sp. FL0594]
MKGSKHVCLLCRLYVANATSKARGQAAQRQAHLTRAFATTASDEVSSASPNVSHTSTVSERAPAEATTPATSVRLKPPRTQFRAPRKWLESTPVPNPDLDISTSKPKATGLAPSSRVDALFKMVIEEQERRPEEAATSSVAVDLDLVKAIAKLQGMVASKTPIADAYFYFRTEVYPAVATAGVYLPQAYHKVKSAMLEKLVEAKKADMVTEDLPPAADILRLYAEGSQLKPAKWAELVAELVKSIIRMDPSSETEDVAASEKLRARREVMVADLVEAWKILSQPRSDTPVTTTDTAKNKGFNFPNSMWYAVKKFANKGNYTAAFCTMFPQYPANQLGPVAVLSIATFAIMHDSKRCTVAVRETASRFMHKIEYLVKHVHLRRETLSRGLQNTYPDLEDYVMTLWPKIQAYVERKPVVGDEPPARPQAAPDRARVSSDQGSFLYRVNQACRLYNSGELDRLWREFVGPDEPIPPKRAQFIHNQVIILDTFVKSYMAINQPEKAVMVWNTQLKLGIRPSVRTWDNMLNGLRIAKNLSGLKNMWTRLTKSNLKLDRVLWTSRVAGLIELGDIQGGLEALNEMVKLWDEGKNKEAVEPTIEPVNAALAGLIQYQAHSAAAKLIDWAKSNGIRPDVITYNTLLRPLLRDGNREKEVQQIFSTMREQGIQANEATFTLILDSSFSKEGMDPKVQEEVVTKVYNAMVASKLALNTQTYAKMLYLLLRSNATTAAMALVRHLRAQDVPLSPQIYTMLAQHCFSLRPPDIRGVHQLIQWRKWADVDDKDRIFYERIVAGFTQVGETNAALEVYMRVAPTGARLDLPTITRLLEALIREGQLEDARLLANTEKALFERMYPGAPRSEHAGYWNHQFWQLAERFKLLDPSHGATREE